MNSYAKMIAKATCSWYVSFMLCMADCTVDLALCIIDGFMTKNAVCPNCGSLLYMLLRTCFDRVLECRYIP